MADQPESQLSLLDRVMGELANLGTGLGKPDSWFEPWLAYLFLAEPDGDAAVLASGGGFDGAE